MDPFNINFSTKKWLFAELITKNEKFAIWIKKRRVFFFGKPILQIEASEVGLRGFMFSNWALFFRLFLFSSFFFFVLLFFFFLFFVLVEGQTTSVWIWPGPRPNLRTGKNKCVSIPSLQINKYLNLFYQLLKSFIEWSFCIIRNVVSYIFYTVWAHFRYN